VRELLCGGRRFNEIRRGVPRISRTMLAERLRELAAVGVLVRSGEGQASQYTLTDAGRELGAVLGAMARWGQRWLPRRTSLEDLDLDPVLLDMQRRVRRDAAPPQPLVIRFDIDGRAAPHFLLLRQAETALCRQNPGFPEVLRVRGPLAALAAWRRGDVSFAEAQRIGLSLDGPKAARAAFPSWFDRYQFAEVRTATPSPAPG
jgi:DNA-binding HxlR family transcriptional regulator